ncbi:MAG: hypothetical protein JWO46_1569 [Nocardioidaceae bacterium]|nr:hypothetical protein [Nocardioidaceae bacterium]
MSAPATEPPTQSRRRWLAPAYYLGLFVLTLLAAYRLTGLAGQSLRIPLSYEGDGLSGESSFKAVLETGWYERNPALGAPWGQNFHDFPLADNLHLMAAHVLGWFTDDVGIAVNVYYLLTFPLAALAGAWFVRVVGGSRTAAFAAGVLFAFAPYHFVRNENQLYLSAYYVVPLGAAVVYRALAGTPLWVRREGSARNPLTWVSVATVSTLACLVLLGTASSYYSVFTLLFLGVVVLVRLLALAGDGLRAALRGVAGTVAATAVLVAVMVANMLPDLLYAHSRPPNFTGLTRNTLGTEIYALKLAQLVLPVSWERLGPLRDLRSDYDTTFPLPSEQPQLGLVAAAGFLGLLLVIAVALARVGRPDSEAWAAQRRLALLNLVGFLFGTIGGLSTLFALFVSDSIRGWNRIAIFLSLFALASLALVLDALVRRATARPGLATVLTAVVALVVTLGGLYDQAQPVTAARRAEVTTAYRSDAAYVAAIERALPAGAMVYQEPYLAFPESPPLLRMKDSDPLRPYLHSTDLRWSYGGIKGRPLADWAASVDQDPLPRRLVELAAAGFDGIHVDRFGYTADAASTLERQLAEQLGVAPVVSRDGRFVFFDLTGFRTALAQRYSAAELKEIGSHAVSHPVAYFQRDYKGIGVDDSGVQTVRSLTDRGTVFVDNPRSTSTRVQIELGASVKKAGSTRITWPDGSSQTLELTGSPTGLSRSVLLPPGRTELTLAPAAGSAGSRIRLTGLSVRDDVLTSFPLT